MPPGSAIPSWGLMSLIGRTWGGPGVSRGWWGSVTCNQGRVYVTDEPEVARPATSCVTAGSILSRGSAISPGGLMSPIGSTWGGPGVSREWRGRITCPPVRGHMTDEPEVAGPAPFVSRRAPSWLGQPHPILGLNEPHWITWGCPGGSRGWWGRVTSPPGWGHMTVETEVAQPVPSWIAAGSILAWCGAISPGGLMSLIGSNWGGWAGHLCGQGGSQAPQGGVT